MNISWKQTWRLLLLIVVLGTMFRLYQLGNNSFVADEFLDINSSYGYFQTGEWRAWDFNFGQVAELNINVPRDERATVYKWQVAQLFRFLPPTEETARLISVFWGSISILVIFWSTFVFTRKKEIGLLASFFFAVSISGIIFDRRLRMYAMFFPAYVAFATTLFSFLEVAYRGKSATLKTLWERYGVNGMYAIPLILLAWLNALIHGLALSIIPVFALYVLSRAWWHWRKEKRIKNKYSVIVGLGILGTLVGIIFFPHILRLGLGSFVWIDNHYSYFHYVLRDFAHPLFGVLVIGLGSYIIGKKLEKQKEALWVTLSCLVPLILAVWFFRRNAGPQYIFFVQSFVLILAAAGAYGILHLVKELFPLHGKRNVFIALLLLGLLLPNWGYFLEENNTYHETSSGDNANYRKVFTYMKANLVPGDALITRNVRNYYWSGAKIPVIDLGDEMNRKKFSRSDLEKVLQEHASGWIVLSDNDYDYFSGEAEEYMKKNLERVSNPSVRGPIDVYRW